MADLESILSRLVRHDVSFVIVGGYAAVAHGCTLVTMDVDICCDMTPANLMKLQGALADIHPTHRMTPDALALELTEEKAADIKNLYLRTDEGQVDCIGEVKGLGGYRDVLEHSEEIDLPFGKCRILTLDGIIRAKKAMDRPRDHETVLQLESIRERLADEEK